MSTNQRTRLFVAYRDLMNVIRSQKATDIEIQKRVAAFVYEIRGTKKTHPVSTPTWPIPIPFRSGTPASHVAKAN